MKINSTNRLLYIFISLILLLSSTICIANVTEFPGRKIYPEIAYIEISDLRDRFSQVVIVDVRSKYEFRTLRIKGAINIPLASEKFGGRMRAIRNNSSKAIIVYCNGKTCMKSYKAVRKSHYFNIDDVTAFDAGIMDWAKKYPKLAVLLDNPLNNPRKLISKKKFNKHSVTPDQFGERLASSNDIVLDVRDRFQREGISIFIGREHRVSLDNRKYLDRYIANAKEQNKGMLIYDAAGKQVRWLQYYLENRGVKNYRFMKGGIHAYYKELSKTFNRFKK